jgi:O-antigen/teichoic acid export membrane protein
MGLLMTTVVTTRLVTADYNNFQVFNNAIIVICILLSAYAENSVGRYFYEDKADFPDYLGTQFFFTLTLTAVMLVQFWVFRDSWAWAFGLDGSSANLGGIKIPIFVLAVLASVAQLPHQIYLQLLLARKRSRSYFAWNFLKQLIYVIFGVILIFQIPHDFAGLVWAYLIATVALGAPFLVFIIRMMRPVFHWRHMRYAMRFSLPAIPGVIALFTLNFFDRILFQHHDKSVGGQYSFAYNVGMLILMVSTGLFSAYMPRFYENMNQGDREANQRIFSRNFKLLLLGALGLTLLSKPMVILLGRQVDYHKGMAIIPIVISGYLFAYLAQCYGLYISYRRKLIYLQSGAMMIAAAANIGLNLWIWQTPWLVANPLALMRAVALVTLVPYLIQWVLVFLIARVLLKEKTVHFQGIALPFLGYLAFAAFWCFFGYGNSF